MEQKERYYIEHNMIIDEDKRTNGEQDITICDTDEPDEVIDLLNQQDKRIKALEAENERLHRELSKLRGSLNTKVEQEKKRIDVLCQEIECKFNGYFVNLKEQCSTIVSNIPTLKVNKYKVNTPIQPEITEIGEIEVKPLKLRFIRGYKE